MLIRFGLGLLYAGRSNGIVSDYDAEITFCWGHRGDVPLGELQWRRIWTLSWDWLPRRIYQDVTVPSRFVSDEQFVRRSDRRDHEIHNSSRWTGRDRRFIGFGGWRRNITVLRSTWRSKMLIYLTGEKERAGKNHTVYVCPAADCHKYLKGVEPSLDWKEFDKPKTFAVVFNHGKAEVDQKLGEYMVAAHLAFRSPIIRAAQGADWWPRAGHSRPLIPMPVYAFRADGLKTLYGAGTLIEARKLQTILNRSRVEKPYQVDSPTDGEVALHAGRTFHIKQQTVRLLLGK